MPFVGLSSTHLLWFLFFAYFNFVCMFKSMNLFVELDIDQSMKQHVSMEDKQFLLCTSCLDYIKHIFHLKKSCFAKTDCLQINY